MFINKKISLYYSVSMHLSGQNVRMSDETVHVQSVSYAHIRSLSGLNIYTMLMSLTLIKETGETGVPNFSLTLYPFNFPRDEHVPLQYFNK